MKTNSGKILAAAVLCLFLLPAAQARAGFEWTPPPAPAPRIMDAGEGPDVSAAPLTPVDIDQTGMPPTASGGPVNINLHPLDNNTGNEMPAAAQPTSSGAEGVAEGFGSDLPLTLVMGQLVPQPYTYTLDLGVDPGTVISWTGGRPWPIVLKEALTPVGLEVSVDNQTVRVHRTGGAPSSPPLSIPAPVVASPIYTPAQQVPVALEQPTPLPPGMEDEAYSPPPLFGYRQPVAYSRPAPVASKEKDWRVQEGGSLRNMLSDWCRQAGVTLIWNMPGDYTMPAAMTLRGEFPAAVRQLLTVFNNSQPRPVGQLYPSLPDGGSALVISTETVMTN